MSIHSAFTLMLVLGASPSTVMLIHQQTPSLNVPSAQGRKNTKQDIFSSSNDCQGMKCNLYFSGVVLQVALPYENANKATTYY